MDSPRWVLAALAIACAALAGCAEAPALRDELTVVESFVASPHKAQIIVYRHESLGFATAMTVAVDGRAIGRTLSQTYVTQEVEPGTHSITSYAEDTSAIKLIVESGKTYYVWQEVKLGLWKARSLLHEVDEATGRRGVADCKPATVPGVMSAVSAGSVATQ